MYEKKGARYTAFVLGDRSKSFHLFVRLFSSVRSFSISFRRRLILVKIFSYGCACTKILMLQRKNCELQYSGSTSILHLREGRV